MIVKYLTNATFDYGLIVQNFLFYKFNYLINFLFKNSFYNAISFSNASYNILIKYIHIFKLYKITAQS